MNTKKFIIIALVFIVTNLFIIRCSEAVEVQLSANTNEEDVKKIEDFFKNNPFPDSAYNVEIDKNVTIQDDRLKFKFKLTPNGVFLNSFSDVIKQAIEHEMINGPSIGIKVVSGTDNRGYKMAVVVDVEEGGPAWKAGVRKDDEIFSYNAQNVKGSQSFEKMLADSKAGEDITLTIHRWINRIKDEWIRSLTVKVVEGKVLKRGGDGELYSVIFPGTQWKVKSTQDGRIYMDNSETKYYVSKNIFDYIIRRMGEKASFSIKSPLMIRYELKDGNGNVIQTSDIKYTIAYKGDDNTIHFDFSWDESQIRIGQEHNQSLELKVTPEKIKEIVASVANSQKEKEEEAKRQKQLEEEQRRREDREAEEKIREEGRKKQEEAKEQRRKTLLPKCNNRILTQEEFLMDKNPHADKGKCVAFMAGTFQMTSAKTGLFNIGNNELAYIEFQKTFRGVYVEGIAKIKGTYTYVSRIGTPNQVPHLEMLEIEEVRE